MFSKSIWISAPHLKVGRFRIKTRFQASLWKMETVVTFLQGCDWVLQVCAFPRWGAGFLPHHSVHHVPRLPPGLHRAFLFLPGACWHFGVGFPEWWLRAETLKSDEPWVQTGAPKCVWTWAIYLTSPSLSFSICKMEIIIETTLRDCCENSIM